MSFTTDLVKNVSIAGHGGTGKTTLFERLLFAGGSISKPETVESGKTVGDSSPEEIERKISIHAALAHIERNSKKINIFDTPGSSDFTGDVILTFRSSEFALLTVDGRTGIQIETIKLWRNLEGRKKPRGIFVTKLDEERADFNKVLDDLKEKFKIDPIPLTIPMGAGPSFAGVIDVLHEKAYSIDSAGGLEKEGPIPAEFKAAVDAAREKLIEAAAEGDDTLMEHYIDKGSLEAEEIYKGLIEALAEHKTIPVFAGSAIKNSGLIPFLDFAAEIVPTPNTAKDIALDGEGNQKDVPIDPGKPLSALVIKTAYDQFSGKLSWVKIITGKLAAESDAQNVSENKKERIGKLYICQGKKLEEVKELYAGDVGIISKSATLRTNDTITAGDSSLRFLPLRLPEPVHSVAVNAAAKKDDDKLGEFLVRAAEEDKTFRYQFNGETKETVISGMGELQVNIILDKVKATQKIEVETHVPRIAYRETITKKAAAEYTHKKQTGGHGQYGKVLLEIAPLKRGENYQFINAIFGGSIPKNYIPGVEKGVLEGMAAGTMAGYPVVDVEVKVVDGKYHPVDSSELAFKLAARNAFREAMRQASPTLLEPVNNLTVFVEDKYLGDVMSDLSGKRGKILGQDSVGGGIEEIRAQVPMAELLRYSIDLRSITSGTGSFSVEFDHYAPISGRIAEDVIKASEAFRVKEEEE
ncbi:translation elongation factor G [Treponema primitia ZAS-2]|uniref:Elongation factor G n=1 Tax=Treponema primitia (strain ATCC BAA-887 / DSM 12427 / ZAS-2) TaxID=545694 RepID=F5YH55_TREPZ|nr:elongation factor G [Treponema primitia]AEF84355.1 translation elongation factor G [Treponema primitia ZAS-2]